MYIVHHAGVQPDPLTRGEAEVPSLPPGPSQPMGGLQGKGDTRHMDSVG